MKIAEFRELIANLPASRQAFRSRRTTWEADFQNPGVPKNASKAFNDIFGKENDVYISRHDLRSIAQEGNLAKLVIASIIWGYPRGMHGHHFSNILQNLNVILKLLPTAYNQDWDAHWNKVSNVNGLGLSTYSKILCFYSAKVGINNGNGERFDALILDNRIIDVVQNGVFPELNRFQGLNYYNAPHHYISYLSCLDNLSKEYKVPAENIELFLFQYGKNLKPIKGQDF